MDEKGFAVGRTNKQRRILPKDIAEKSKKSGVPAARMDGSREWVTVVGCICGDGTALSPALIFKGAAVGSNWLADLTDSAKFWATTSVNGWTTSDIGLKWLTEVFDPETRHKDFNRRRLLIMDGHASHVNFKFLKACDERRISVLIFPPHSTHRLQPLDVGILSPLSTAYTTVFEQRWGAGEGRVNVDKAMFFSIFSDAWDRSVTEQNIKHAWAKSGILPLDRNVVLNEVFGQASAASISSPSDSPPSSGSSSPLGEGGSHVLLRKVRTGRIDASKAVFKLSDRVTSLEARQKVDQATIRSLRQELDRNKQKRAFKPIHPNHEEGRAYFLGPQEMMHARQQQEEDDEVEAAERERKRAKKEQAAANKAERERRRKEKGSKRGPGERSGIRGLPQTALPGENAVAGPSTHFILSLPS